MATTRFHALLEAKIKDQIAKLTEELVSGSCKDFAAYKDIVGCIRGLNDSLKLGDEVESQFDNREPS